MSQQIPYYYTRKVLSWLCLISAVACLILFFVQGMQNYILLVASIVLFILAYFISPHQKNNDYADLLLDEMIIEGIFWVLSLPIRLLGKLLQHIFD